MSNEKYWTFFLSLGIGVNFLFSFSDVKKKKQIVKVQIEKSDGKKSVKQKCW